MKSITIELPMEPYGKKDPKRGVSHGPKPFALTYAHPENKTKKAEARHYMARAMDEAADEVVFPSGGIEVSIIAIFLLPKSQFLKRHPRPRQPHLKKPDEDNVSKWIKDAGTGLLWTDDKQVVSCHTDKMIGAQGERPRVYVTARAIDETWLHRVEFQIEQAKGRLQ